MDASDAMNFVDSYPRVASLCDFFDPTGIQAPSKSDSAAQLALYLFSLRARDRLLEKVSIVRSFWDPPGLVPRQETTSLLAHLVIIAQLSCFLASLPSDARTVAFRGSLPDGHQSGFNDLQQGRVRSGSRKRLQHADIGKAVAEVLDVVARESVRQSP